MLTYGLLAVQLTPKILHEYQSVVYRMLRSVIGDHPYRTHNTHQQALKAFNVSEPLDLLSHLAMRMQHRLGRRSQKLLPTDVLHQVDWTHLLDTLHLIQMVKQSTIQVPVAVDPADTICTQAVLQCPHCEFRTTLLPNLRRHLTLHHKQPQLRTSPTDHLALALNGRPHCSHCRRMFTTWRSFQIHVQRDCCQVLAMTSTVARAAATLPPGFTLDHLHVATQSFWPVLKDIVQHSRWNDLGPEHEVGEHLAHHCLVCGVWTNRFQELHSHLRLHHSELLLGGVAKGAQLTALLGDASPCLLCSAEFQRVHSCPVTLQIGILHILNAQDDANRVAQRCDICQQDFATMQQLYQHLFQEHSLTINDWCQARDAMATDDACAHCGAVFDSRSGLRRHITEGRCPEFDPLASSQTCDVESTWGQLLRQGKVYKGALSAIQRLRLTTHCQLCGMSYDRQGDLVAHLLQTHGPIWQRSQPLLRFLLQTTQLQHGCMCNPMSNEFSVTHVCVGVRQIAMLYEQSTVDVLVTHQFQEGDMRQALEPIANDPMFEPLIQTLVCREFDRLWTAPEMQQLLRTRCIICGGYYRADNMMHHLLTMHPEEHKWAAQILFQITACMRSLQHTDHQCSCCGLIYNLPALNALNDLDRSLAQAAHFDFCCPVARQIGVLLLPWHGTVDTGSAGQGIDGEPPNSGSAVAGHQKRSSHKRRGQDLQATQTRRFRRHPARSAAHTGSDGHHAQGNRTVGDQSREEPESLVSSGLLRYVRPIRSSRSTTSVTGPSPAVARVEPEERLSTGTDDADLSAGWAHAGVASPSSTAQCQQGGGAIVGHSHSEGHDLPGGRMDLSEMVSGSSAAHPCPEGVAPDASHAEDPGADGRAVTAQHACDALPQPEEPRGCGAVVSPGHPSRPGAVDTVELNHPQHGVEPTGDDRKTTHSADVKAGDHVGRDDGQGSQIEYQRTGKRENQGQSDEAVTQTRRQALRQGLLCLVMGNTGTLCYANSAVLSYLWASLSRTDFRYSDWGALSAQFQELLTHTSEEPVHLDSFEWFQNLVANWSDQFSQADSAEFTHRLLSRVNTPIVSNEWQRLVFLGENMILHDLGAEHMPITLQLDPSMIDQDEIHLNTLIRTWHNELGMVAGLTQAADLVVIHLDRFVRSPTGRLSKLRTAVRFCWEILLPILNSDATCHWDSFHMIAAFSHQGSQTNGHYQAILRTFPELSDLEEPTLWLHCDDHRRPERCLTLPPLFEAGATCFWLSRSSKVEMHRMHSTATRAPDDADNAVLQMLRTQPNLPTR